MKKETIIILWVTIIGALTTYFIAKYYNLDLQSPDNYSTFGFLIRIGLLISLFLFFAFLSWQLLTRFENRRRNYALVCFSIIVLMPVLFQSYFLKMAIEEKLDLYISETEGFSEEKLYYNLRVHFNISIGEIILLISIISYSIFKLLRVNYSHKLKNKSV